MVQSSDPEAIEENIGWKETQFIVPLYYRREYRGGDSGSQEAGPWFRFDDCWIAPKSADSRAVF
jgi:hypothetical protein